MERFVLSVALACLRYIARGDHSFAFRDRISDAETAIKSLLIYYPKKAFRP